MEPPGQEVAPAAQQQEQQPPSGAEDSAQASQDADALAAVRLARLGCRSRTLLPPPLPPPLLPSLPSAGSAQESDRLPLSCFGGIAGTVVRGSMGARTTAAACASSRPAAMRSGGAGTATTRQKTRMSRCVRWGGEAAAFGMDQYVWRLATRRRGAASGGDPGPGMCSRAVPMRLPPCLAAPRWGFVPLPPPPPLLVRTGRRSTSWTGRPSRSWCARYARRASPCRPAASPAASTSVRTGGLACRELRGACRGAGACAHAGAPMPPPPTPHLGPAIRRAPRVPPLAGRPGSPAAAAPGTQASPRPWPPPRRRLCLPQVPLLRRRPGQAAVPLRRVWHLPHRRARQLLPLLHLRLLLLHGPQGAWTREGGGPAGLAGAGGRMWHGARAPRGKGAGGGPPLGAAQAPMREGVPLWAGSTSRHPAVAGLHAWRPVAWLPAVAPSLPWPHPCCRAALPAPPCRTTTSAWSARCTRTAPSASSSCLSRWTPPQCCAAGTRYTRSACG